MATNSDGQRREADDRAGKELKDYGGRDLQRIEHKPQHKIELLELPPGWSMKKEY